MSQNDYPYEIDIEVAFRDLDAMEHVNNQVKMFQGDWQPPPFQ